MLSRRIASTLVVAAFALGAVALPAQAALRHIDGTVVSKNAANHSFRIKTQSGNQIRIKVNGSTQFQRIPGGFGGLHKGLRIEVEANGTTSGLVATHVETGGGGGGSR
jgi:ABC-type phosphate transport system substrate-binding protein